jgi:hypothetical protein
MHTCLLVVSVAVALVGSVSTAASGAPNGTQAETVCTNGESREVISFTPGVSETPTVGSWFSSGDVGTEECTGPVLGYEPTGPVTIRHNGGRLGTNDPDTCSTGGEGFGVATHTIPTKNGTKTIVNTFTFTYGGLSHGAITGTFEGDYYSGTVVFEVLEGDCVTKPITKARIAFAGTWHDFRAPRERA